MLKKLAAIGLGAALVLSPVVTMAQTSTDTTTGASAPATPAKPAAHKHNKHVSKKHKAAKPAPKKTEEAPKS